MEARAYVLIEAESGKIGEVLTALRAIDGLIAVDAVTGPYDIVATVQTPDPRQIGRLVMNDIHAISGVKRTITCMVIG
ncbi:MULTISPECIES: Lrp/AsnC family transcriptional regulator [Chloroflexus]|jgi:DNA-binding Lrp family transcriptional regulator|uniref:Transcriptional regulator, AsnC family n=2 Tax=Chloroflexus aggregans TaxID=152260 RepID=B8G5G5_CHLAD|nr:MULTISPECIES: Lrp/AsnC ligand binding domain-containing protein [Chloroflexus]ACL25671.1 transcriptional regulator, AsnC family [Chloroflexus aggregans DSM 9485]PMP74262.1 MAG: AsnC family transcriptional regulator [Chloroflexus aggregans]GIV87995.1 MAG: AsnC family transcriptional regulator [Chloroflexus sp.]